MKPKPMPDGLVWQDNLFYDSIDFQCEAAAFVPLFAFGI